MIGFILGLFFGLFLGWLQLRKMATKLNTMTEQSKQLRDALNKSSALLRQQQAVIELKEPAPNAA